MKLIRSIRILKFVISAVVITAAGWLASDVLNFRYATNEYPVEPQFYKDNKPKAVDALSVDYKECLKSPSKLFCIVTSGHQLRVIDKGEADIGEIAVHREKRRHPMNAMISDFIMLTKEFDIEVILIEPSMLYCMLKQYLKVLLMKHRHDMKSLLGSSTIVNFAMMDKYSAKMKNLEATIEKNGFKYYQVPAEQKSWLDRGKHTRNISTHHFLVRRRIVIHVAVLFERGDYLWHAKLPFLPQELREMVPLDDLLFARDNSAYERFSTADVDLDEMTSDLINLTIPDDPANFLYQIPMSRFLECGKQQSSGPDSLETSSEGQMTAFVESLKELKQQLRSTLVTFFLIDSTLISWYKNCDFPAEDKDIQFAISAADAASSMRISEVLTRNDAVKLLDGTGLSKGGSELQLSFQNTVINIRFFYENVKTDALYVVSHKGSVIRYAYPNFTICSADVYRQLVRVPCETKVLLEADSDSTNMFKKTRSKDLNNRQTLSQDDH